MLHSSTALGTFTLVDSWVFSCWGQLGGGILNIGTLKVTNSKISSGTVGLGANPGIGGGILNFGGTAILTGSTVADNFALYPQASCFEDPTRGCGGGGGIYNTAGGVLELTNSKLLANYALDGGGLLNHNGTVTLTNSTVADNEVYPAEAALRTQAHSQSSAARCRATLPG